MIAERVVHRLLEDDEDVDPKAFAMRPDVQYDHPIWQIDAAMLRPFMAAFACRIVSMRRRKRGSLVVVARKDRAFTWEDINNFSRGLSDFLDGQFKVKSVDSPFTIQAWAADTVGDDPSDKIDIAILKHTEDSNPYA